MTTLVIDTALQSCAAAIVRDGACLALSAEPLQKGHAEHVAPMVKAVLEEAGVSVKDLTRIGVVVGPGGFTGVRVGLAFARSMALGVKAEIMGVTSLKALAIMVNGADMIAPVIDARRDQVFAALYSAEGDEILAPFVSSPEASRQRLGDAVSAAKVAVIGSGALLIGAEEADWEIEKGDGQIDILTLAHYCAQAPLADHPPTPLYLRAPDVKAPGPSLFGSGPRA